MRQQRRLQPSRSCSPFLASSPVCLSCPPASCAQIEPMNRESEHLELVCLTQLLGVGLRVAYLDQSEGADGDASMRTYDFPDGIQPRVHLLYR